MKGQRNVLGRALLMTSQTAYLHDLGWKELHASPERPDGVRYHVINGVTVMPWTTTETAMTAKVIEMSSRPSACGRP